MNMRSNPANAYKQAGVKTAGQGKLIIMLYDECLKQVKLAYQLLEAKKQTQYDKVNTALIKAQDIVTELMVSLDMEKGGPVAQNLFSLYTYFNKKLLEANLNKDDKPLAEIQPHMQELREAWVSISKQSGMEKGSQHGGVNIAH